MRLFRLLIACFIFCVLQMLLAPKMAFGEISPDFALLLVAYFSLNRTPAQGAVSGFFVGFLQDLLNPELLGLNALTKSITGYGLGVAGRKAEPDNVLFLFATFAIAVLGHDLIYLLFFTKLHIGRFFSMWLTISVPSAIYTALVGVVVHKMATYIERRTVRVFGKARP